MRRPLLFAHVIASFVIKTLAFIKITSTSSVSGTIFNSLLLYYSLFLLFSSVQLLSCVSLFTTPWTSARQASLSITNFQSLPKLMSIELVMPSNHRILCHPFLLLPSILPSIRVFSSKSVLHIRWPKY